MDEGLYELEAGMETETTLAMRSLAMSTWLVYSHQLFNQTVI